MFLEDTMLSAMRNFMLSDEYKGVTETWNVLQHEVDIIDHINEKF